MQRLKFMFGVLDGLVLPLTRWSLGSGCKFAAVVLVTIACCSCDFSPSTVRKPKPASPIATAAKMGDLKAVERLLQKGVRADETGQDGVTALAHAVLRNDLALAEMLLKAGADPNGEMEPKTLLQIAARKPTSELLVLLLRFGGRVNGTNADGYSPMFGAALSEKTNNMAILLSAGADINARTRFGSSPLLEAMRSGTYHSALFLIQAGALITVTNIHGETPLDYVSGPCLRPEDAIALKKLQNLLRDELAQRKKR